MSGAGATPSAGRPEYYISVSEKQRAKYYNQTFVIQ